MPIVKKLCREMIFYELIDGTDSICITMAFYGGPGATVVLEELHAMGVKLSSFVVEQGL